MTTSRVVEAQWQRSCDFCRRSAVFAENSDYRGPATASGFVSVMVNMRDDYGSGRADTIDICERCLARDEPFFQTVLASHVALQAARSEAEKGSKR